MNIGIYIYDQAEVLDFSGPFEVFSIASRICTTAKPFTVYTISEKGGVVTARGGYSVNSTYGFDNHPPNDVLIVVGGVHQYEMNKPKVMNWIAAQATKTKSIASVCTGAFLLAQAGVLSNHKVTTHWQDLHDLREQFPELAVLESRRWVDEGKIVTSGGISAGIDMSLHLVSKFHSMELAEQTARQMEFDWTRNRRDKQTS